MLQELTALGNEITTVLQDDPFCQAIEPEFLRQSVQRYPLHGGKRLRPALAVWSAGAVGGDPARARFAAAAVEVWHNWTLVHDDIIDDDRFRRGIAAEHVSLADYARGAYPHLGDEARFARFGRDFAILAGDLQQSWANHLLLRSREAGVEPGVVFVLMNELQRLGAIGVISGEALDVAVEYALETAVGTVERILYLKTGALLEFAATAGAMAGLNLDDPGDGRVRAVGKFAAALGIAFQLRDDWLGIYGDEKFGKPLGSDWKERKPTMLYLTALEMADEDQAEAIRSLFGLPEYGEKEIGRIRELLEVTGAAARVNGRAAAEAENARSFLARLPENPYRGYLESLTAYLLEREV